VNNVSGALLGATRHSSFQPFCSPAKEFRGAAKHGWLRSWSGWGKGLGKRDSKGPALGGWRGPAVRDQRRVSGPSSARHQCLSPAVGSVSLAPEPAPWRLAGRRGRSLAPASARDVGGGWVGRPRASDEPRAGTSSWSPQGAVGASSAGDVDLATAEPVELTGGGEDRKRETLRSASKGKPVRRSRIVLARPAGRRGAP
jgi:hypothetical protein